MAGLGAGTGGHPSSLGITVALRKRAYAKTRYDLNAHRHAEVVQSALGLRRAPPHDGRECCVIEP